MRKFRECPSAGKVRIIALIQLKPRDSDVNKRLPVIFPKDAPRLFFLEVGHKSLPDQIIARERLNRFVKWSRRMYIGMFPQVDLVIHTAQRLHHLRRIRKGVTPLKAARVRVGLPSRLNAKHIARNLPFAEFPCKTEKPLAVGLALRAIPDAEPPLGWIHASA